MNNNQPTEPSFLSAHSGTTIHQIIGVTSGKGGVGKSTITALLATHAQKKGYRVGILDADITGPSIPQAFHVHQRLMGDETGWHPEVSTSGIKMISVNLMLEHETDPVLWRGPMISNMVKQFYTQVLWDEIDLLLVDFPPGTSDVAITMFQVIPLSGIVVVTSPQNLVSMIVQKAIHMAEKMNIPLLGIIENMAYFECPTCHQHHEIFGHSNLATIAETYHVPLLAKLPINPRIAQLYDAGQIEDLYVKEIDDLLNNLLLCNPLIKKKE